MHTKPPSTESHSHLGGLLKETVFGFNDGIVSTFAVIAGLSGGGVSHATVLLAGLATLLAGAFSMGLGTYLGSKSEKELYEKEYRREKWEIKNKREEEVQEIRDIYAAKKFKGKLLDEIVDHITSDEKLWLDTMMREELGFAEKPPRPGLNGLFMAIAFVIGSAIPNLPYFFPQLPPLTGGAFPNLSTTFFISMGVTCLGLLAAGAFKTRFTGRNVFMSALETLLIGVLAAGGTYAVGLLFE